MNKGKLKMKILSIIFCCLFVSHQLGAQEVSSDVFEIFPVLDFNQSRDMPKDGYEKLDYSFELASGKILHEDIWIESKDILKKKATYIDFSDLKDVYMFYSQGNADPVFCNINQLHLPDEESMMLVFKEGGAKKLSSMTKCLSSSRGYCHQRKTGQCSFDHVRIEIILSN